MPRKLLVDGMMSGTGVRDEINGGYIDPVELGLSAELLADLKKWLFEYKHEFTAGYQNEEATTRLDEEGVELARRISIQCPNAHIAYFSDVLLKRL